MGAVGRVSSAVGRVSILRVMLLTDGHPALVYSGTCHDRVTVALALALALTLAQTLTVAPTNLSVILDVTLTLTLTLIAPQCQGQLEETGCSSWLSSCLPVDRMRGSG